MLKAAECGSEHPAAINQDRSGSLLLLALTLNVVLLVVMVPATTIADALRCPVPSLRVTVSPLEKFRLPLSARVSPPPTTTETVGPTVKWSPRWPRW